MGPLLKMNFRYPVLAVVLAIGNLLPAAPQMAVTRDADGVIHAGDSDFRIVHWNKSWSGTLQNNRSVILSGEGGDNISGKGIRRTGTFNVAGGAFRYAETVQSPAPNRLDVEYELDSDTPVPTAMVALCATFPADTLLKRTPKYNGKPFAIPEAFDEKRFQIWTETRKLNTLELPLPSGILVIRGRFSAMWQDNRKYGENNAQLRLCFLPEMNGGIRHAEAAFSFEMCPYEVIPELKNEALYYRAKAYKNQKADKKALDDFRELAKDTRNSYGAEAKYQVAQALYDAKEYAAAEKELLNYIEQSTPHAYWLARSFVLLSDVYVAMGKDLDARQYLLSLQQNYQGNDDIESMIEDRLKKLNK